MQSRDSYKKIWIDDALAEHRELSIYRKGTVNFVRLTDQAYTVYNSFAIPAHDYAALFHFGIIEELNALPFLSETDNGLDSWDESFLPNSHIGRMVQILNAALAKLSVAQDEEIMLGWQDAPEKLSYWRKITAEDFREFLEKLIGFCEEALRDGYDLEFIM
ncbi:MAG: hypothetical protein HGB19_06785 [Chlorobiales bacterium]|jgi:hypothetical protein|nr:hypothetical protein [Chlorobiales bacterium]